jgi:hypothetical protein
MKTRLVLLFLLLSGCAYAQEPSVRILDFHKFLSGTDKMLFMYPPIGETWTIVLASAATDKYLPGVTFSAWIEDAPFQPYRHPITGALQYCKCLTIVKGTDASTNHFFPMVGWGSTPRVVKVAWPNRIAVGLSPQHGALPETVEIFVSLQISVAL